MMIQIQARLLDGAVLSFINRGNQYESSLTQLVQAVCDVSKAAILPVLRRLKKERYLITKDQPLQVRNRRYYQITNSGNVELKIIKREWWTFSSKLNKLIGD